MTHQPVHGLLNSGELCRIATWPNFGYRKSQVHAVSMQGLQEPWQAIQRQDGHGHGMWEDRISALVDCPYMLTTILKSVSSMKLHRELGIGQKAAWFLAHRLRKALGETETRLMALLKSMRPLSVAVERHRTRCDRQDCGG